MCGPKLPNSVYSPKALILIMKYVYVTKFFLINSYKIQSISRSYKINAKCFQRMKNDNIVFLQWG